MTIFHQEKPTNKCKFIASVLKEASTLMSSCHYFRGELETEETATDFDEDDELFVSAVIRKYMESKCKRKCSIRVDSIYWTAYKGGEVEEFHSVDSRLSRCSSATAFGSCVSLKTCLSRCSSLSKIMDDRYSGRRSMFLELGLYQGWPFGLYRKALLLPPPPKSPSDSWLWRKGGGKAKP